MSAYLPSGRKPRFWCREHDVLEAFRATAESIRTLTWSADEHLDTEGALYLADRLREQRELVRQVLARKKWGRARRLLHLHRLQRDRFLRVAIRHGLNAQMLALRCRVRFASTLQP